MLEKEIEIIKLKDKFLYKINIYNLEDYLMNGKQIETTFKRDWYVSKDEPKILQEKDKIKVNERWELKNKDLYNETIPLVVDEHTKEKYNSLIKSDLYSYSYDEKEILNDIPLKVIQFTEINEDIPFNYKEIVETNEGWYCKRKTTYLIERVKYSIQDNCLVPEMIKELTKPCILPKEILYEVLVDYIKRNIDRNIAKITSDYSFCIRIEDIRNKRKILEWENNYDKRYTLNNLYANNFKELTKKLDKMKHDVINYINKRHICEQCNGTGFSDEELNLKKYYNED